MPLPGFGPKPQPESEPDAEWEAVLNPVEQWRFEELQRAGWEDFFAFRLAVDSNVDLHRACDILRGGCTPERALEILT